VADVGAISDFLQQRLEREGITEIGAVQAAQWLDAAGLLRDSQSRPGKPLRDILRNARETRAIVGAYQESNRRWKIRCVHSPHPTKIEPQSLRESTARSRQISRAGRIVTTADARSAGFSGFVSVAECIDTGLPPNAPSSQGGVYLLCAPPSFRPEFIPPDDARTKGNVCFPWPVERLVEKWVKGAEILYIGKGTQLRRRLRQLIRHSQGLVVTHTGGEIVWQLRDSEQLIVCWHTYSDPRRVERALIQEFRRANQGQLPFANRQN
jgi:hypothetical protein